MIICKVSRISIIEKKSRRAIIDKYEVGIKGYLMWISSVGNKWKQCVVVAPALAAGSRRPSVTSGATSLTRRSFSLPWNFI